MPTSPRISYFPGRMDYTVKRGEFRNPNIEDFADQYRLFTAALRLLAGYPPTDGSIENAEPCGHGLFAVVDWLREVAEDLDQEFLTPALAADGQEDSGQQTADASTTPQEEPAS